jgi:hypothetical protein
LRGGLRREEGILITCFHGPEGPFFHRVRFHCGCPFLAAPLRLVFFARSTFGCARGLRREEIVYSHLYTALKGRSSTECASTAAVLFWPLPFGWSSLGRSAALRDGLRRKEGIF